MPWWLVPISSGFTTVIQYYLLGFDLPFNVKKRTTLDYLKQTGICTAFTLLALNTWRVDITRSAAVGNEHGWVVQLFLRTGLAMSSGNFLKSMALWGGFFIQAPKAALQLKPKYAEFGYVGGFPVSPCGAVWLNPMKWVYAVVLLPYVIPIWLAQYATQCFVACGAISGCLQWTLRCGPCKACLRFLNWSCCACGPCHLCWKNCCQCLMCIKCWHYCVAGCCFLRAMFLLTVSFFGTVFTLSLWAYPRQSMLYWSDQIMQACPILGLAFITLWAWLCPYIFTALYAAMSCGLSDLMKGLNEGGALDPEQLADEASQEAAMEEANRRMDELAKQIMSGAPGTENLDPSLLTSVQEPLLEERKRRGRGAAKKTAKSLIPMPHPEPLRLDPQAQDKLKCRDPAYETDFEGCSYDPSAGTGFKPEKIAVVHKTLAHQQNITLLQLTTIITLRSAVIVFLGGTSVLSQSQLFRVYLDSLTERKWSLFSHTVMDATVNKLERNRQFQLFLHYLWTIL